MLRAALIALLAPQEEELRTWLDRLQADDVAVRARAAAELVRRGPLARASLLELRASSDPETAHLARRTLGRIDWDPTVPPCFRGSPKIPFDALGSADPHAFEAGIVALRDLTAGSFAPHRARDLDRDEARKKILFVHAGVNESADLRDWALALDPEAFWSAEPRLAFALLSVLEWRSFKGERFPYLKPLLSSGARSRRLLAALVLASEGDDDALPVLLEFLGDPHAWFVNRVPQYLMKRRYPPALPRFLERAAAGDYQAFHAVGQYGWDGHLDVLRKIADRDDLLDPPVQAHQELARRGDRSGLPRLLKRIEALGRSFLHTFETSVLNAALAYDTDEAIETVLRCMDKVDHWGGTGWIRFGPHGARVVWDRFTRNPESKAAMYVRAFCAPGDLVESAREALHGDVPPAVLAQAIEILVGQALDADDRARLREIADGETGGRRAASALLASRGDADFLADLVRRAERAPDEALFGLLAGQEGPGMRSLFLRHRRIGELARFRDREAAAVLAGCLADEGVRERALETLWKFPDALLREHQEAIARTPGSERLVARLSERPLPASGQGDARGYRGLGPEGVDLLVEAAWTEVGEHGRAAIDALGRIGGEKVGAFLRECVAESDRGRPTPRDWPLLAARLGEAEAIPSILRRVKRSPSALDLLALDLLVHREGYARLPVSRSGMVVETDLSEAFRVMGEAYGIAAEVSPALGAAFRGAMSPEERGWNKAWATAKLEVDLRGPLVDVLATYEPKVTTARSTFGGCVLHDDAISWAPLLDTGRLRILTLDEAAAWWRTERDVRNK